MVRRLLKPTGVDQEESELTAEMFEFAEMEREAFEKVEEGDCEATERVEEM